MRHFGRSLDVDAMRAELPLTAYYFDILRREGDALVDAPARDRFTALADVLPSQWLVPRLVTSDAIAAQAFYDDALGRGHEGVMAKSLDAGYEAGGRCVSIRRS